MKKATRWAWLISTVAITGAGLVLAFLLSIATNNPSLYERHYVWLFWVNVVVATLLVLVICIAAVRLVLRVSRGKFGSRLLLKLAAIFAPLRGDPEYNTLLTRLVGWRCPSHPGKAFALLTRHAAPGWQTPIVNDTIHWLESDDARADDYALQLPMIDLTPVDPQRVAMAAQLLVRRFASHDKLQTALDWTLKLPTDMAPQARAAAMSKLVFNDDKQRAAAEQWIRRAVISDDERASLLQQVSQRTQRSAGSK